MDAAVFHCLVLDLSPAVPLTGCPSLDFNSPHCQHQTARCGWQDEGGIPIRDEKERLRRKLVSFFLCPLPPDFYSAPFPNLTQWRISLTLIPRDFFFAKSFKGGRASCRLWHPTQALLLSDLLEASFSFFFMLCKNISSVSHPTQFKMRHCPSMRADSTICVCRRGRSEAGLDFTCLPTSWD